MAKKLGVTRQTIYNWLKEGAPAEKIKGLLAFDPEAMQNWLLPQLLPPPKPKKRK